MACTCSIVVAGIILVTKDLIFFYIQIQISIPGRRRLFPGMRVYTEADAVLLGTEVSRETMLYQLVYFLVDSVFTNKHLKTPLIIELRTGMASGPPADSSMCIRVKRPSRLYPTRTHASNRPCFFCFVLVQSNSTAFYGAFSPLCPISCPHRQVVARFSADPRPRRSLRRDRP